MLLRSGSKKYPDSGPRFNEIGKHSTSTTEEDDPDYSPCPSPSKKLRNDIYCSSTMYFGPDSTMEIAKPAVTALECIAERQRRAEYEEILRIKEKNPNYEHDFLQPPVTPVILNVVASASVGQTLDLKLILDKCPNVEYNPKRFAPCVMRLKNPKSTCLIFASGRLIVSGCKSESESYVAVRRYCRILQTAVDPTIKFTKSYEIQNMSASCTLPFALKLQKMASTWEPLRNYINYEPELFPGLVWRLSEPKARVVIFCGGAVLFTGLKSEDELNSALRLVYPICRLCRR